MGASVSAPPYGRSSTSIEIPGALTCGHRIYHISFWIAYHFIARVPRPLYADPTRSKQSPLPTALA
jgi:hypothetical protein